jgi:hypothetical protein
MELRELFQTLSKRAVSDNWEPVLHYLFRAGHGRVHYPSDQPLTDTMHAFLYRIEYDAVPLVAMNTETEDTLRTQRLVYDPDTETYYYGVVTTPLGELDCMVCWYAVPSLLNDALEAWLKRYWSGRDAERFLDELMLVQNQ